MASAVAGTGSKCNPLVEVLQNERHVYLFESVSLQWSRVNHEGEHRWIFHKKLSAVEQMVKEKTPPRCYAHH